MKKIAITLLIILSACKQKDVVCKEIKYKVPCQIAFSQFQPADLDTLIINYYPPDNSFRLVISSDTEICKPQLGPGSLIHPSDSSLSFASLSNSSDIEISVLSIGKSYKLHALYSYDSVVLYQAYGCRQRGFYMLPSAVQINGNTDSTIAVNYTTYCVIKQ